MDRYFIVLASLGNCEAENARVQDVVDDVKTYLRRLSTSDCSLPNKLAVCSSQLYLSVLYTKAYATVKPGLGSSNWTLCHEISNFDEDATLCSSLPAKTSKVKNHALEDVIHELCDKLPILGTCLVDVICVTQKVDHLPTLEEKVELFGALSRLIHWHRANITVCYCCEDARMVKASSWDSLLPYRHIQSPFDWDRLFVRNIIWRGGIHLNDQILGGFQLTSIESCGPSIVNDDPNINSSHFLNVQMESSMNDGCCLDGVMTVLGKFPLVSIPPHVVSSTCFELSLPHPMLSLLMKNSAEFLSQVNSDENICFMLRLGIWTSSGNTDGNLMNTISWKRKVVAGNFKVPDDSNRKEVGHRLFLLIGDGLCTKHSVTIFALRNVEDYSPKTCMRLALANARSTLSHAAEPTSYPLDSFIKQLPLFSSQDVKQLRKTLLEKQILGIHHLIDKMGNEVPAAYLQSISKEIGSSVIAKFKTSIKAKECTALVSNGISPSVEKSEHFLMVEKMKEPANWPERILLKRKDAHHKYHGELEHSLKPAEVTFLKIDELLTRLQSMEKCKTNILTSTQNSDVFSPSPQFRPCWPEAMYGNFPDVYYCNDQSREVKQQQLNCLEARHIVYDTVSSLKNDSEGYEGQMTPRLLPLIQSAESRHAEKVTLKKQSIRTQPPKMQTRSAKDKKDINRKATMSSLSEKNLQKLRIAVVDALELHNIRLKHPLFKTCAKKLFTICQTFAKDIIGTGSASKIFMEIAESHVQQVVHFEMNRPMLNLRNKKTRTQ